MICDPNDLQTDFFFLRDGPVLVTSDRERWEAVTSWLQDVRGYRSYLWQLQSQEGFYTEASRTLAWDEQFGYARWNGNLDAFNDGLGGAPFEPGRVVIAIDNAHKLTTWFGKNASEIWSMFYDAARIHLLCGVGLLVVVHTASESEAARWIKIKGVLRLERWAIPDAQLAKDAGAS